MSSYHEQYAEFLSHNAVVTHSQYIAWVFKFSMIDTNNPVDREHAFAILVCMLQKAKIDDLEEFCGDYSVYNYKMLHAHLIDLYRSLLDANNFEVFEIVLSRRIAFTAAELTLLTLSDPDTRAYIVNVLTTAKLSSYQIDENILEVTPAQIIEELIESKWYGKYQALTNWILQTSSATTTSRHNYLPKYIRAANDDGSSHGLSVIQNVITFNPRLLPADIEYKSAYAQAFAEYFRKNNKQPLHDIIDENKNNVYNDTLSWIDIAYTCDEDTLLKAREFSVKFELNYFFEWQRLRPVTIRSFLPNICVKVDNSDAMTRTYATAFKQFCKKCGMYGRHDLLHPFVASDDHYALLMQICPQKFHAEFELSRNLVTRTECAYTREVRNVLHETTDLPTDVTNFMLQNYVFGDDDLPKNK
jgi:hypothetical protein